MAGMDNEPAYGQLRPMTPARHGKMPPTDGRFNWGLFLSIAALAVAVAFLLYLAVVVLVSRSINENMAWQPDLLTYIEMR